MSADPGPAGPLRCRVLPVGPDRQRASLMRWDDFRLRPYLLTSRMCRNPLVADAIDIEIENTSGAELLIYPNGGGGDSKGGRLFWAEALFEDTAGRPAVFPSGPSGLKRFGGPAAFQGKRPEAMAPGEVVRLKDSLFSLRLDADIKPGIYTGRVVCYYTRPPGDVEEKVVSAPFRVTITEGDVRGFRRLRYAFGAGWMDWVKSLL